MKVYVIVGLDSDGNIDTAGAFVNKSDAHKVYFENNLAGKIAKAVVLPVTVEGVQDAGAETARQV